MGTTGIPGRRLARGGVFGQAARPVHDLSGVCGLCPAAFRRHPLSGRRGAGHLRTEPGAVADSLRAAVRPVRAQADDRPRTASCSRIGSAVAAMSTSIGGVIFGRVLQGAGAVGSVILALVADLTSEENRTKAMAMVGITIGASFMVALVTGPILATFIGVDGIFWLMVGLALVGIAITEFVVPTPRRMRVHRDAETVPGIDRLGVAQQGAAAARFRHLRAACDADGELPGGARLIARHARCVDAKGLDRLSAGAGGFGRRDGAGDHRRREISSHEGRVRRRGRRRSWSAR